MLLASRRIPGLLMRSPESAVLEGVGYLRNLLRFLPRFGEDSQLALERTAFGLLVHRHLERETRRDGHALERRARGRG